MQYSLLNLVPLLEFVKLQKHFILPCVLCCLYSTLQYDGEVEDGRAHLDEAVEQLGALAHLRLGVGGQARQRVEHQRELSQRRLARDLQHVEQRLGRRVAHARLALAQARHDRVRQLAGVRHRALPPTITAVTLAGAPGALQVHCPC